MSGQGGYQQGAGNGYGLNQQQGGPSWGQQPMGVGQANAYSPWQQQPMGMNQTGGSGPSGGGASWGQNPLGMAQTQGTDPNNSQAWNGTAQSNPGSAAYSGASQGGLYDPGYNAGDAGYVGAGQTPAFGQSPGGVGQSSQPWQADQRRTQPWGQRPGGVIVDPGMNTGGIEPLPPVLNPQFQGLGLPLQQTQGMNQQANRQPMLPPRFGPGGSNTSGGFYGNRG